MLKFIKPISGFGNYLQAQPRPPLSLQMPEDGAIFKNAAKIPAITIGYSLGPPSRKLFTENSGAGKFDSANILSKLYQTQHLQQGVFEM
jgi:hypothetical protein